MTQRHAIWLLPLSLLLAACSGGFESEDVCRQTAACLEETDGLQASELDIDVCVGEVDDLYDGASNAAQDQLDSAYAACEGRAGCDFFACFCDETGSQSGECEAAREASG